MPAVLAGAGVGEPLDGQIRKAERIVKFTVGEQSGVRGHGRTEPAVEIEPQRIPVRFTRRVRHEISLRSA